MADIVFFSGRHRIDHYGAVSVIASNVLNSADQRSSLAFIGMGDIPNFLVDKQQHKYKNLLPEYLKKSIFLRIFGKLQRELVTNENISVVLKKWIEDQQMSLADRLASNTLRMLLQNDKSIKIAIGLVGDSLEFGKLAKRANLRYIVHSQFCHPNVQKKYVDEGYQKIGIKPPAINERYISRQLETLEMADAIWCPSEMARTSLLENGVDEKKVFVKYLTIDIDRFRVAARDKQNSGQFRILFVGNIGVQKGIHILLDALTLINVANIELILNGAPDQIATGLIKTYEQRLRDKEITIKVDPGDPTRYHANCSLFVLPSVHDSYGIVVMEAMASGLPVIVSDHVGAQELVRHNENGYIFPSSDAAELSSYIEYLYHNPDLRARFGLNSADYAEKIHHEDVDSSLSNHLVTIS